MTTEELLKALDEGVAQSRQSAARVVGPRIVLSIEAMGYRMIPTAIVERLREMLIEPPTPAADVERMREMLIEPPTPAADVEGKAKKRR